MKKQKAVLPSPYKLPNGEELKLDGISLQVYRGDFFTIFISQPGDKMLHDKAKTPFLHPLRPVHLQYRNTDVLFEIYLQSDALDGYDDFASVTDLQTLIPFWSLGMEKAVDSFLRTDLEGPLADRYIYARVIDLLIQLTAHIRNTQELFVDQRAVQRAELARAIILEDLSVYDTVGDIAHKVGISETELQRVFKYRFGMTVGKFSRITRMELAHRMLEECDDILLTVSLMVGYNDPGNFSVAFKNYFGYSPGYIQKKKRAISQI